jgi:hypothetical protein
VLANADDDAYDFPTAQRLADEHGFDMGDAVDAAAPLVLERWSAIEAVARALRAAGEDLSGERVQRSVRRSPASGSCPKRRPLDRDRTHRFGLA